MSKKTHPKYKVKDGDTLQRITILFGVEESIWSRYHNNMCRLDNVIRDHLPKHLEEIYLLPELWDKEEELNKSKEDNKISDDKRRKAILGYNNSLPRNKSNSILNYAVVLKISSFGEENTIRYKASLRKRTSDQDNCIIEFNKISETLINNEYPDLVAEQLAAKTAKALYPVEVALNRQNEILGINNYSEIIKRWEVTKKNIRKYYEGATLEKYLSLNDKSYASEENMITAFGNDWFLHGYFDNIYGTYGMMRSFSEKIKVPFLFDSGGVEFTATRSISEFLNDQQKISVKIDGYFSDERSVTDLDSKLDFHTYESDVMVEGKYKAEYIINPEQYFIENINLETSLKTEQLKAVSLNITLLNK
ncbi:MAG: hypothetical protein ACK5KL_20385 [Dysgonomonas sp.]